MKMEGKWKFRGYDAVGKKGWVYGDLTHTKKVIKEEPYLVDRVEVAHYEVYPESVGLFTGMVDKNGTEIYEGDIVNVRMIDYDGKEKTFPLEVTYDNGAFNIWSIDNIEVVGKAFKNKIDNI